ncbi:cobyrinic acid a,c-diamide synthase [Aliidongia dinghuensis]|uniref:Cobyrinate a,c-diamide synthase n=1 Tax=Aliidongia dinghuensis TaxID=1867774 RepID=A0A8J2YRG5_9PROT|nr:cobyrinate a,c-diamide synthase [Aliidongia dinghuensis]GGF06110.1 cobyrinic acid a,c-diamide synthase [Aliidongia dinghuensis]
MTRALVIAAPASGSGKTMVTLGLLRAFRRRGVAVGSAKVGPDYIDPAFHAAASGRPCRNLDPWAMRPETLRHALACAAEGTDLLLVEGVMGLFDGAADGGGSTADLAALTGLPVALVLDVRGQTVSAAATAQGFARFRDDVTVAAAILNRVGSARHADLIRPAFDQLGLPVLGALARADGIAVPSRHLGLVQAGEQADLEGFLERAADLLEGAIDLDRLAACARPIAPGGAAAVALPPLGRRIAVARDIAFAFAYPHVLDGWRAAGVELDFFSPLADEAPPGDADAVYLPGGYPELHAGRLAAAAEFRRGMLAAAARGAAIYGECGGYMALGDGLIDGDGVRHAMLGLLPVETSFAVPRRQLGYRRIMAAAETPLGPAGRCFRGHEFHFARETGRGAVPTLFETEGHGAYGALLGRVFGSFLHLIDQA